MKNRRTKKLRLRKEVKEFLINTLGIVMFYAAVIGGVLLIDYRFKTMDEQQKSADVVAIQTARNNG